jgi:hypothetical protein
MNDPPYTNRRKVLQTFGAGVVGGVFIGTGPVAGQENPKPPNHEFHTGDSATVGGGQVTAFGTTNPKGKLSSLGVHLDGSAFTAFNEGGSLHDEKFDTHLHFPEMDTHQFTFNGFHYNPEGHAPPGIYTVPHFDFHFYFIEEEVVEGITGGPLSTESPFIGLADYEVPDEQFPSGYMFEQHRLIVKEMGEHLLDGTAPEFHGEDFTHTNVYGAYNPAIDPSDPDSYRTVESGGDKVEHPVYGVGSVGRL